MTTTYLLFRHGTNDAVDKLFAGRAPGLSLNDEGRRQADQIAARFSSAPIRAIYSSPLERAMETAAPLAKALSLSVQSAEALLEVQIGGWTGKTFQELQTDPTWHRFNSFRSSTCPPAGEFMVSIQARAVAFMEQLRARHPGEVIALFSHADVIKAALLLYSGIPVDFCNRLQVYPGSMSAIALDEEGARILRVNDTGAVGDIIT